jgi:hypothetical protein
MRQDPIPTLASPNIQENDKYLNHIDVLALANWLHSHELVGQVLRVLIHRLREPQAPYTDEELSVLLALSVAEQLLV